MQALKSGRSWFGDARPRRCWIWRVSLLLGVLAGPVLAQSETEAGPDHGEYGFVFMALKQDWGFTSMASEAIGAFEAETGLRIRQRRAETPEESERALRDFASRGVGNIFMIGYQHAGPLARVAPDYPSVRFTLIDAEVVAPNVRSLLFHEEQAGYLAGVAAGSATVTGRLGVVGGAPFPPVLRFVCGFIQGARAVRSDVDFRIRYLSQDGEGFRHVDAAAAVTRSMLEEGVDIVFPPAGLAVRGVLREAAEAGKLGIGVDTNVNAAHPGHVLTSAVKRVDMAIGSSLKAARDGAWTPGTVTLGLAEGAVGWARDEHNAALVAPFAARIETAKADLVAGRITILPPDRLPDCMAGVSAGHGPGAVATGG